jgi:CubicO group peptidase (beta-lactamase class C family)
MISDRITPIVPAIVSLVTRRLDEHGVPGAAIGLVRGRELAWSGGFGYADLATERRPDERTLFRVASITKTFTATAIVQLRDEGKLSLDDPLVRHLPEFSAVHNPFGRVEDVTLRRLLTHRSGLVGEPPYDHWETLEFPDMAQILGALDHIRVVIEPDSAFKYSNLALSLLGEVVSRLSGRPYVDHVRRRILEPLGMSRSTFDTEEALDRGLTCGYGPHPFEDYVSPAPHSPLAGETAAGQLYSCVADLARWIALQLRADEDDEEETPVLSCRSLREMHRPHFIEEDWCSGQGLGWRAARRGELVFLGHGGTLPGFRSEITFNKARRLGAVVLLNGMGPADVVAAELLDFVIRELPADEPAPLARPTPTPAEWRRFLGSYRSVSLGALVSIECRGGSLVLRMPPGALPGPELIPLEATERPEVFIVTAGRYAGEPLTFRTEPNGSIGGFVASRFPFRRLVEG